MRKAFLVIAALIVSLGASAQFEKGKWYGAASLSGLSLSYNSYDDLKLGIQAKGGYLLSDNWMVMGIVGYEKQTNEAAYTQFGAGLRYYFVKNGIYIGATASYMHNGDDHDDFMPSIHAGYAFFLSKTVTLEPEVYYNQSVKDSDYNTIGLRIGLGIYI